MADPTNVIINGTFTDGETGWSGTDIEASYTESAYLHNGSHNRVAELDGHRCQTTVMEQTFTITDPTTTELTLDAALRLESNDNAGQEGFTVEILDSCGTAIASTTIIPTVNTLESYSLPVTFPSAGDYTLRFTEIGPDDSLGAFIDNVELLICFAGGTGIATPAGERLVDNLRAGDIVMTRTGPRPIRWIGKRRVGREEMARNPKLRPVCIARGALGAGLPDRDLWVSRQHRMVTTSRVARRMFGQPETLVAAIKLAGLPGIAVDETIDSAIYYHLLFDRHKILFANGAPCESLLVTERSLGAMTAEAREELQTLFPELCAGAAVPCARIIPENREQRLFVERLGKNGKPVLEHDAAATYPSD